MNTLYCLLVSLPLFHVLDDRDAPPVVETIQRPAPSNDGLSMDARGRLHASQNGAGGVTDGDTIHRLLPSGVFEAFAAGLPAWPVASDFGPDQVLHVSCFQAGVVCRVYPDGSTSELAKGIPGPAGLAVNASGEVFVASWTTHSVRRIDGEGIVSVVAAGGSIRGPSGLALDPSSGALYVGNWADGRITRIAVDGEAELFAALTPPEGTGVAALEIIGRNLYATLWGGHRIVRVSLDTGVAENLVGNGEKGHRDGAGSEARLAHPVGLAASADGRDLFFTEDSLAATTAGGEGSLRVVHLGPVDPDHPGALTTLRTREGLLLVRPRLDGRDAGWFLFDTAAWHVVNRVDALDLGLKSAGQVNAKTAIAIVPTIRRRAGTLELGPLSQRGVDLTELDLTDLGRSIGIPIAGLLGAPALSEWVVEFDRRAARIELFPAEDYSRDDVNWLPLVMEEKMPCLQVEINGEPVLLKIDTGAGTTAILYPATAARLKLDETASAVDADLVLVDGEAQFKAYVLESFVLGEQTLGGMVAFVPPANSGSMSSVKVGGNFGGEVFDHFTMILDISRERVAFVLNEGD